MQHRSKAAGVDGITVDLFAPIAGEQIQQLQRQLQRETYSANPAKGFYLGKKSGGHRLIGIPTVRDRIVQRFLLQTIYPRLERIFSESTFAYRAAFIAKLNDAEAEAAETQTWIEFAVMCSYLDSETGQELYQNYNDILAGIERLIDNADTWVIRKPSKNLATDETATQ